GKRRPPPQPRAAAVVSGSADCLKGCKFVVTGVLPTYERTDLEELIKRHGGAVTQAVSGKTTHLVAGSALDDGRPTCQSSKYQKASQNSIPILTEAGLLAML
ncbi:BRCT domain-containing protein, partial [Pelagophyceae sp. CCMP2097]